jgi:hypothetical protein
MYVCYGRKIKLNLSANRKTERGEAGKNRNYEKGGKGEKRMKEEG